MEPLLELRDLMRVFLSGDQTIPVLQKINLTIYQGEMVAIVGPSGCGKSTLMNILGCLDKHTSGCYKITQRDVAKFDNDQLAKLRSKYFGFIFQRYHLLNKLTATENVGMPAIYSGMPKNDRRQRAHQLLAQLGLKNRAHHRPGQLSGGQQQRVSIARALMNGGHILLADEPTGALDSEYSKEVMGIFDELHQMGHTIIFVTHDINLASHAERIIQMQDGKILSDKKNKRDTKKIQSKYSSTSKTNADYTKGYYINEIFKTALQAILSHRMRSFLTMLGVIIGIASVVSVVAIGDGAQEKIINIASQDGGLNAVHVTPGDDMDSVMKAVPFTLADLALIEQQPFINSASPEMMAVGAPLRHDNNKISATLYGVGEQYLQVLEKKMLSGSMFSKADILSQSQVAIIDQDTHKTLFPNTKNPIGKTVFIKTLPFKIIGTVASPKNSISGNKDYMILAPHSTIMSRFYGSQAVDKIVFRAHSNIPIEAAKRSIKKLLSTRYGHDHFQLVHTEDRIKNRKEMLDTTSIFITCTALISLLIGGIGIMNIMLVSVTERTQEIGIRIAVGAKQSDILRQFLIEAILMCVIGGLIGIILSFIIGILFNQFVSDFQMSFSIAPIILACVSSVFIGIIFGFLPARNAARLDPAVTLTGN